MKCPSCGSENVNLISNTTNRGFRGSDACCGYMLMGPLGILCGSFGSGKKKTNEFWVCNNCGSRFQDKEIKKYNQKVQNNTNYYEPDDEEAVLEPDLIDEPVEAPIAITSNQENDSKSVIPFSPKTTVARSSPYNGTLSADALLKRALIFLEDGDWEKAYEYSENALDVDAGYAEAYLVKFMAEYHIFPEDSIPEKCADMMSDIDSLSYFENYRKAQRFGDDEFEQKLENYSNQAIYLLARKTIANSDSLEKYKIAKAIYERIPDYSDASEKAEECEKKFFSKSYAKAEKLMSSAESENDFLHAKSEFERISDYMDSAEKAEQCSESAKEYHKKYIYNRAKYEQDNDNIHDLEGAIAKFSQVSGYKDADERIQKCRDRIKELEEIKEKERAEMKKRQQEEEAKQAEITKKRNKICAIVFLSVIILIILGVIIPNSIKEHKEKEAIYNQGITLMENGSYDDAIATFKKLKSYKDSSYRVTQSNYKKAISLIESGSYSDAIPILEKLGDFEDASEKLIQINTERESINKKAEDLLEQGLYDEAISEYMKYGKMCVLDKHDLYIRGIDMLNNGSYIEAMKHFAVLGDDYQNNASLTQYTKGILLFENGSYTEAKTIFTDLDKFKDSAKYLKYISALSLIDNQSYSYAQKAFEELGDFRDAKEQLENLGDISKLEKYSRGLNLLNEGSYNKAIEVFTELGDYKDSADQLAIAKDKLQKFVQDSSYVAVVLLNGKYGYINEKGAFLIEPIFYYAGSFDENGIASVKINEEDDYKYINTSGEFVSKPQYDTTSTPRDTSSDYEPDIDLATGKWGYINKKGDYVIQPQFDYAGSFANNGIAIVNLNNTSYCINKQGEILFEPQCDYIEQFADNGLARIGFYKYGSTFYPDEWGYIDSKGNIVIEPQFNSAYDFTDSGLARVGMNKKYGYIDITGNVVIDFQFDEAGDFKPIPKGSN